jgi:hypothetical protein
VIRRLLRGRRRRVSLVKRPAAAARPVPHIGATPDWKPDRDMPAERRIGYTKADRRAEADAVAAALDGVEHRFRRDLDDAIAQFRYRLWVGGVRR